MRFPSPLAEARLERRYKRFLADVTFADGRKATVHCPNPGSMTGLKSPGLRCWVSESSNPKRKLKHTLELVEADGTLVGINTGAPNKLAEEAIRAGVIRELAGYDTLKREVRYGANSRIDLLLETKGASPAYVEVKNCHMMRTPGLAEFPDSVTVRGTKHLRELAAMKAQGARAVQLFIIQRNDCDTLSPARDIDPAYANALFKAVEAGVEVFAYACEATIEAIKVVRVVLVDF